MKINMRLYTWVACAAFAFFSYVLSYVFLWAKQKQIWDCFCAFLLYDVLSFCVLRTCIITESALCISVWCLALLNGKRVFSQWSHKSYFFGVTRVQCQLHSNVLSCNAKTMFAFTNPLLSPSLSVPNALWNVSVRKNVQDITMPRLPFLMSPATQYNLWICFSTNQLSIIVAQCLGSRSCWRTKCFIFNLNADCLALFLRIWRYCVEKK
jgi:hypothetical protein